MFDEVAELIVGSYDLHIHSSPDIIPRKFNDIEIALEAKKAKMAGILIKNHFIDTSSRAFLTEKVVDGINIFGGIVLNKSVGGLNPAAVEISLKLGSKEVWMPTIDSFNHRAKENKKGGLLILGKDGKLKKDVYEILENIIFYDVILGTGHLSLEEIYTLIREALNLGVKKILVTHPEYWITYMPIETQITLSKQGVFFERCYYSSTLKGNKNVKFDKVIECINKVGFENTIISTDLGQKNNMNPVDGLKLIITSLLKSGFKKNQIKRMTAENPGFLVN